MTDITIIKFILGVTYVHYTAIKYYTFLLFPFFREFFSSPLNYSACPFIQI
jgi:hypothetical protein